MSRVRSVPEDDAGQLPICAPYRLGYSGALRVIDSIWKSGECRGSPVKEHSVRNYIYRIFEKLGVSSRVELILYAFSQR
jgi:Bacterial regulatory proteins, luxR family